MAQVKFWRGDFDKYSALVKEDGTVYFVSNITVGMLEVAGETPKPYSGIFIGSNLIASSQTSDVDMDALESIIGNVGELEGKTVVQWLKELQTNINTNTTDIASLSGVVGDGQLAGELSGKTLTEAINSLGDIIGNTVEGSIGNLGDIHQDIQGGDIVTVINNLDDKTMRLASFESNGTADNYQIPASYTRFTYGEVKGKSAEEILDLMLFPDTLPTVQSQASASLTVSGSTTYMEIGAPFNPTLTVGYNQGVIGVSGVSATNRKYRGIVDYVASSKGYVFSGPNANTTAQSTNTQTISGYKIVSGNNTWGAKVDFKEGEMPVSAKGNEQPQLRGGAGSVNTSNITVQGVYPVYTNKVDITSLGTKESLVANSTKSFDITFAQANGEVNRFKIAIAKGSRGALNKVELWNDLSGKFDVQSLSLFAKGADENKTIHGIEVAYEVWACTASAVGAGARYRFTFA